MIRNTVHIVTALCVSLFAVSVTAQEGALPHSPLPGLTHDAAFFPGANYDASIPTPDQILGFVVGSKPVMHDQVEAVIKAIAAKSPRVRLFEHGKTHEGRTLYHLVIGSEANIKRLDAIKTDLAKLADPRSVSGAEGDKLADSLPAVAWMGYCIHGDEMSGTDAALAVAHHLAACTDDAVRKLLDEIIVIIDPLMNPDGRDRWIRGIHESRTTQPSVDDQSVLHTGVWPSGRTNHYLFDMNRDWLFASQPESRGRILAARDWHPHYFMESHEMGSQDTFLFQPPREPINHNIPQNVRKWLPIFGKDQGHAFDRHGWRYYTGEWNEEWYPGYSGAWGGLRGAVENLYEQASIHIDAVRRPEGTLESYREGVHKQLVSTMANLTTLAAHRRDVVRDFVSVRRQAVAANGPYGNRMFAIVPGGNTARFNAFTSLMHLQGFEMHIAGQSFTAGAKDRLGRAVQNHTFPAGTVLIPVRQPLANHIAAVLEFDPRMTPEFLNVERRELLRFSDSKMYDVTGWNLTMLYDVEGYELNMDLPSGSQKYQPAAAKLAEQTESPKSALGFAIHGADDHSVSLAGRLMERGVWVRIANKAFTFDGKDYSRGTLIIANHDNQNFTGDLGKTVADAAGELGLAVTSLVSGWGDGDLPDLGGRHFELLHLPRIALLGREPFSSYSYGEIWHLIDHVLGLRASYINSNDLGGTDLRRYNVLVMPSGDAASVMQEHGQGIRKWVEAGGTLIAIESSARALARAEGGIGSARMLPDVIDKADELESYRMQIVRDWQGRHAVVDPAAVWSNNSPRKVEFPWTVKEGHEQPSAEEAKRRDAWRSIFMPQGALLAARVDDRHWLTMGCESSIDPVAARTMTPAASAAANDPDPNLFIPVMYARGALLMAKDGVEAPVRMGVFVPTNGAGNAQSPDASAAASSMTVSGWAFAPAGHEVRLRMSGLLWPEAADRIAHTAYLTRERVGSGQVILFAGSPTFRAGALGTARLLSNAMVYGPGMGTQQPIKP